MKDWLNLLPWRNALLRKKQRKSQKIIVAWGLLLTSCFFLLSYFNDNMQQSISFQQQQNQRQQQQLNQLISENHKLKLQQQIDSHQPISAKNFLQLFKSIQQFPFEQGELQQLNIQPAQIQLLGFAQTQTEFDEIVHYLHQQNYISESQLRDFSLQTDGKLHFDFELKWNDEENNKENP